MECCICLEEINDDFTTTFVIIISIRIAYKPGLKTNLPINMVDGVKCPMCRRPSFEDDEFNLKPSTFQILRSTVKRMLVVKI